jgi:hypothetical protein
MTFTKECIDETLPNFTKNKALKKGREKETRDKDQSPGKQTAQTRQGPGGKGPKNQIGEHSIDWCLIENCVK